KGKHAIESSQRILPPSLEALKNDFCVAIGQEAMIAQLEFSPQLPIIVDLAIVDNCVTSRMVPHGLVRVRAQVDNAESIVSENRAPAANLDRLYVLVVGPAAKLRFDDLFDHWERSASRGATERTANSTHRWVHVDGTSAFPRSIYRLRV